MDIKRPFGGGSEEDRLERLEALVVAGIILSITSVGRDAYGDAVASHLAAFEEVRESLGRELPRSSEKRSLDYVARIVDHLNRSGYLKTFFQGTSDVRDAEKGIASLQSQVSELRHAQDSSAKELHTFLAAQTLGVNTDAIPLIRYVSIRTYLPDGNLKESGPLFSALNAFLDSFGLVPSDEIELRRGSLWKRTLAKTKDLATQPEVQQRLQEAEHALKLKVIEGQQAEINVKHAEATGKLLAAVEPYPYGAFLIGSLLIIKTPEGVVARTLVAKEMIHLEKNPALLKMPQDILAALSACHEDDPLPGRS